MQENNKTSKVDWEGKHEDKSERKYITFCVGDGVLEFESGKEYENEKIS